MSLLDDPLYRKRMFASIALGQTARTTTIHASDNQDISFCGRRLRFLISAPNAPSNQHEFDINVSCFSCQRSLAKRRSAQRMIRNHDARVIAHAPLNGHRSRLSPLAC